MTHAPTFTRRNALIATGALAAGASLAPRSSNALVAVVIITGIDGGGAVQTETGEADFAIFATQIAVQEDDTPLVIGQVRWAATAPDGTPLALDSRSVDEYGWIDGVDGGRWARGTMAVNGDGAIPFGLRAVDGGPPGSGKDTIELLVGNAVEGSTASDFSYRANGTLVRGGLQLLELAFDAPLDAGS